MVNNIIGTPHTKTINGIEFTYGWMRYNTSIANREREFYRINGKRVSCKVFWQSRKEAEAAEKSKSENS